MFFFSHVFQWWDMVSFPGEGNIDIGFPMCFTWQSHDFFPGQGWWPRCRFGKVPWVRQSMASTAGQDGLPQKSGQKKPVEVADLSPNRFLVTTTATDGSDISWLKQGLAAWLRIWMFFFARRNGIKLPQPVRKKPDNHQQYYSKYGHYIYRGFSAPSKRWLVFGFLNHQQ